MPTDHIADFLFASMESGQNNLIGEGIAQGKIRLIGNVMFDATQYYRAKVKKPELPKELNIESNSFVLCTVHLAENPDDCGRFWAMLQGLVDSGQQNIPPMHPRTKSKLKSYEIFVPSNI